MQPFVLIQRLAIAALLMAGACGSDGGSDVGSGTHSLTVRGQVSRDSEHQEAVIDVSVERAGTQVSDATVVIRSELGDLTLVHEGGGQYTGVQAGWAGTYSLEVVAGADRLDGAVSAPEPMTLLDPDPTTAINARAVTGGVLTLRWSGAAAETIRVRSKDFEYQGDDAGHVDMPAVELKESSQDLELRRTNQVVLAGGVAGSTLTASCRNQFTLIVTNPY